MKRKVTSSTNSDLWISNNHLRCVLRGKLRSISDLFSVLYFWVFLLHRRVLHRHLFQPCAQHVQPAHLSPPCAKTYVIFMIGKKDAFGPLSDRFISSEVTWTRAPLHLYLSFLLLMCIWLLSLSLSFFFFPFPFFINFFFFLFFSPSSTPRPTKDSHQEKGWFPLPSFSHRFFIILSLSLSLGLYLTLRYLSD